MLTCEVISPEKFFSYTKLKSITLPASSGRMQVLAGHAESFILLGKGNIFLKGEDKIKRILEVNGGECYIKNKKAVIIL